MASSDCTVHSVPVEILEARIKQRPPGRTPAHLALLDIGVFPSIPPSSTHDIPKRPLGEKFHFLKWIHRTNNSDLALVTLQNGSNLNILKIHKNERTFLAEKAAYARLNKFKIDGMGDVLKCYGWSTITPTSFSKCDSPTCSGDENGTWRSVVVGDRDPSLPARTGTRETKATYSWANPEEKQMREHGVDFRPPSIDESWFWIMNNSQFGSDGELLPSGQNLRHERHALLLEYLPNSRTLESHTITRNLALQALAGAQLIQKALVRHGDPSRRNILVTEKGRVVWVDFDRALVLNEITENELVRFKKDLITIHGMLFPRKLQEPTPER